MKSNWKRTVQIGSLLGVAACDPELRGGVCIHEYRDPLIVIQQVTDRATGRAIPTVALTGFGLNGRPLVAAQVSLGDASQNVRVRGDTLWCDVRCGFGSSEGNWGFTVSASGYDRLEYRRDVRFRIFKGGCPSYNAGSTELALRLEVAPPA